MDMNFYTLDNAADNLDPIYYVSRDTLFAASTQAIIPDGFPLFKSNLGLTHISKSFNEESLSFEDSAIKAIAYWESAPLFEIVTVGGRVIKLSPNQLVMCVESDYDGENELMRFTNLAIESGLDETSTLLVKDGGTYKFDGVKSVLYLGLHPVYYVLSSNDNFVLDNGAVLINF